jgi:hypothetical protein
VNDQRTGSDDSASLLGRPISELGLRIEGSPIEALVAQLYRELAARGLSFQPPVYFTDQWGCPDGIALIGVPFYLADRRLTRIEEEQAMEAEGGRDAIRYLRHEAGHAFSYAYHLYERPDWHAVFGPYSRPYRERFHADPFSRSFVRHLPGWYAQKHPDEDFAESFAVWLTPGSEWRKAYSGWPALQKLEYVDRVMAEVAAAQIRPTPSLSAEHLPVESMHYTIEEHYRTYAETLDLEDARFFDADLQNIFAAPAGSEPSFERTDSAAGFLRLHRRDVIGRVAYWTGVPASVVGGFVDFLAQRAAELDLRVHHDSSATLIEVTAFVSAVIMNYRYTNALDGDTRGEDA